jgi:hypothetical protein
MRRSSWCLEPDKLTHRCVAAGSFTLKYRGSGQCGVRAKSNGHCDKESDRAEIKPVDGNQRTPCVREQADGIRRHGPDDTSEPLRWPRLRFTWRSLVRSTFAGLIRKRMFFMASPRKFHKL